ncbi:MAG TPA: HEAT repeat domain-containing protein [Anaerolineales bacterium]|nr:HEAT repeat domain-containing protein [Anaerolineales bacterium]
MMSYAARLASFFRIRSNESRMVALVTGMMFFASAGGAIGSPGIEALFYARFGVQFLPYMYIALGIATLAASLLISTVLGRVSARRLYVNLPLILGAVLGAARLLLAAGFNWFYPLLWLGMNMYWILQSLYSWGLAGEVCDARQAKRLFPLFGAGGIFGLTLGGLVTQPFVAWLGADNLLLIWVVGLLLSYVLARTLMGTSKIAYRRRPRRPTGMLDEILLGYRFARRSPLLHWMAIAAVLFAVLYYSLVFPFSKAAAANFPDEDVLAGFLGLFNGISSGAAILASLLLANRIYARFGFMTSILIYPLLYLTGFAILFVYGAFPVLVALRFTQLLWSDGVSEGANQAMYNVVPADQREQTRAFVRGVANQFGISLVGVILVIGQQTLRPQHMYLIGLSAAALTTFLVWRARHAYGQAVVDALRAGQPHLFFAEEQPFGGFRQDAAAIDAVLAGINSPEVAVRRVSAEILGNLSLPRATDAIVRALADEDATVRRAVLRSIARANAASALLEVLIALDDPDPGVRLQGVETVRQLAGYPKGVIVHLELLLGDPDPAVRSRVAAILLEIGPHPEAERILIEMASQEELHARLEAFKALADWGSQEAYDLAARSLDDPLPVVRAAAATIMAHIDARACLFPLVETLGDEDRSVRRAAAQALQGIGTPAVEPVVAALSDPQLESGALLALEGLPVSRSADAIQNYARDRVATALRYHDLWRSVGRSDRPDERLQLLADSLRDASLRYAIHALNAIALFGDREGIALAIENLDSNNMNQRANAIETLESLGQPEVVRPLLDLWESGERPEPSRSDWMQTLLDDPDPWLRACTAFIASDCVHEAKIQAQLATLAHSDPDALVRESAANALNGGPKMETLATLSIMERILFLRKVPIFSHLPPADLKQIAEIAREQLFSQGQVIVRQGEPGYEMFIIVSGEVQVSVKPGDGEEIEIARRHPGEFVGEMAIISQEPRMASLIAATEVRTLSIDQEQFEGILRLRPETSLAVIRVLGNRLRERAIH